ncbi:hypothetical protein [Deinococcus sp. QL22]|uniref:hypothetical protein n=1 Tax=Deinococcus sp. QL22 TaxID=2939437 RepID=UPI002016D72E|nr:hypothetical protein [Deinococcus sp. QL22]UQN06799.1 hypothetical protein M1R55_02425 [Deinococcus sp. QL22]
MKSVRFANGNFAISISKNTDTDEVNLDIEGMDDADTCVEVHGYYSPDEAREIASYLIEMADQLDVPERSKAGAL